MHSSNGLTNTELPKQTDYCISDLFITVPGEARPGLHNGEQQISVLFSLQEAVSEEMDGGESGLNYRHCFYLKVFKLPHSTSLGSTEGEYKEARITQRTREEAYTDTTGDDSKKKKAKFISHSQSRLSGVSQTARLRALSSVCLICIEQQLMTVRIQLQGQREEFIQDHPHF